MSKVGSKSAASRQPKIKVGKSAVGLLKGYTAADFVGRTLREVGSFQNAENDRGVAFR